MTIEKNLFVGKKVNRHNFNIRSIGLIDDIGIVIKKVDRVLICTFVYDPYCIDFTLNLAHPPIELFTAQECKFLSIREPDIDAVKFITDHRSDMKIKCTDEGFLFGNIKEDYDILLIPESSVIYRFKTDKLNNTKGMDFNALDFYSFDSFGEFANLIQMIKDKYKDDNIDIDLESKENIKNANSIMVCKETIYPYRLFINITNIDLNNIAK